MAVPHDSALSPSKPSSSRKRNKPSDDSVDAPAVASNEVVSSRKRTKSPGVRVVGGRVYDSEKGTTCHQCRQKTMDFTVSCKQMRNNKPCTVKFCHKCLLNRYGESAEEMEKSGNWGCPKCRGVCNCSFCMKKKGQQPTGILVYAAKATGFSSVHDLLDKNGTDVLNALDGLKTLKGASSPLKEKVPKTHKRSHGQENHDGQKENKLTHNRDEKLMELTEKQVKTKATDNLKGTTSPVKEKALKAPKRIRGQDNLITDQKENELAKNRNEKPKDLQQNQEKTKVAKKVKIKDDCGKSAELVSTTITGKEAARKGLKDYLKPLQENALASDDQGQISVNETSSHIEVKPMQKMPQKQPKEASEKSIDERKGSIPENNKTDKVKAKQYLGKCKTTINKHKDGCGDVVETKSLGTDTDNLNENSKYLAKTMKSDKQVTDSDIDLPKGEALIEVVGAELLVESVGPALQFLEFCNAFAKVLDVRKGEPEYYLRDLARGRRPRRGVNSPIINFITKIFSVIQEDMDEKSMSYSIDGGDSWLSNLVKFIDQSACALKKFEFECFPKNPSAFDCLEPSKKLEVLNFLCDEALQTEKLRNWMEDENSKYVERKKETQKIIFEAKKKGNDLKKKLKDDIAKAMLSVRDGTSLSIEEQSNLISQIKEETEKVHAEMLETTKLLPKIKQRRDAVRSDPLLCEEGHVYWELEGYYNTSKILLQEVRNWNSTEAIDRWFSFDEVQEKVIEQHISMTRNRQLLAYKKFLKEFSVRQPKNEADDAAPQPNSLAEASDP